MEPIAEPPPPPPSAAAPPPAPGPQRRAARAHAPRRRLLRALRTLLLLALLCGVGGRRLHAGDQTGQQSVQLRERVQGDVEQAVDEIKGLIEDNMR